MKQHCAGSENETIGGKVQDRADGYGTLARMPCVAEPVIRHAFLPGLTDGKISNAGVAPAAPHIRPLRPAWAAAERLGDMDSTNILYALDRVCGQFAAALQHAGPQIYERSRSL